MLCLVDFSVRVSNIIMQHLQAMFCIWLQYLSFFFFFLLDKCMCVSTEEPIEETTPVMTTWAPTTVAATTITAPPTTTPVMTTRAPATATVATTTPSPPTTTASSRWSGLWGRRKSQHGVLITCNLQTTLYCHQSLARFRRSSSAWTGHPL